MSFEQLKEKYERIQVAAVNYATLFKTFHKLLPTYGLNDEEIFTAMRKAINMLEAKE